MRSATTEVPPVAPQIPAPQPGAGFHDGRPERGVGYRRLPANLNYHDVTLSADAQILLGRDLRDIDTGMEDVGSWSRSGGPVGDTAQILGK